MLHNLISKKAKQWLALEDCPVRQVVEHIRARGFLRDAQTEAIEVYLYLKIEGQNKPLWQLLCEGRLLNNEDLAKLNINQAAREIFEQNSAARALFEMSRVKNNGEAAKPLLPNLEKYLLDNIERLSCEQIVKDIFYGVEYTDYLFSLPMGAGKTFLMAAFIYLDLYFAQNEPGNKIFAHNFIILVPSGLKTSIIPSLKTIERFDPAWVLPEPAASNTKKLIKFEILDQPKSAKKSNKARNPNAQKINHHQPFADLMGLVMVTNAEKVILDRLELDAQQHLYEQTEDEKDRAANELRNLIGKVPNLQILIDEVHHAATDDIKLRQVVNRWSAGGTVNSVLGFSGTPYLSSAEKIQVNDEVDLKFTQITNTVYYYPLKRAIQSFLKKPTVKPITELNSTQIVRRGVREFYERYGATLYSDGTCAKLAVYCGSIERLEEEIHPLLVGEMGIPKEDILKYHRGNARYKITKQDELDFASLDTSLSKKRVVLLVQIGKEGWDCKSLTGVILSQKGDCPTNMVLQTSCRCLRQVVRGEYETAGVWLNEDNANVLDKQLKEEQHTSIAEINSLGRGTDEETVERFARLEYLKLPSVDFYQLRVNHDTLIVDEAEPRAKLGAINARELRRNAAIIERGMSAGDIRSREFLQTERGGSADFGGWLFDISKGSFGAVTFASLRGYESELRPLFDEITYEENGARYFNDLFELGEIAARVRLAFHRRRTLQTSSEVVPKDARMLLIEKLTRVKKERTLYPCEEDVAQILKMDESGESVEEARATHREAVRLAAETLRAAGINLPPTVAPDLSPEVENKDRTFHFLPYDFTQSNFELEFLKQALKDKELQRRGLELYYNGERSLTEFKIQCFTKINDHWRRVGEYTPDFLLLERKGGRIHRVLIIETKGKGFAEQKEFQARKRFMETEFIKMNNERFGYKRFGYLYLTDERKLDANLAELNETVHKFFVD